MRATLTWSTVDTVAAVLVVRKGNVTGAHVKDSKIDGGQTSEGGIIMRWVIRLSVAALSVVIGLTGFQEPIVPILPGPSPTPHPQHPYVTRTDRRAHMQGNVNGMRVVRGRSYVWFSRGLSTCAQAWSERMGKEERLYHQPDSFCSIDAYDIVGKGPTIHSIMRGFWVSDNHRPTVLCDCSRIGVGAYRSEGYWWVTVMMKERQ